MRVFATGAHRREFYARGPLMPAAQTGADIQSKAAGCFNCHKSPFTLSVKILQEKS
jgi:nitrate reductase cytochrome c-type subunit